MILATPLLTLHSYGIAVLAGKVIALTLFLRLASQAWSDDERATVRPAALPGYALLASLFGLLAAIGFWRAWRRERRNRYFIFLGLYALTLWLAAIAARVAWVIITSEGRETLAEDGVRILWTGGALWYAGAIVALALTLWWAKRGLFGFWRTMDQAAPAALVASAAGSLGCFLAGCCYGAPCEGLWCVAFPPGSPAAAAQLEQGVGAAADLASLPVHPLQLYLLFVTALLAAWGFRALRRGGRFSGEVALRLLASYLVVEGVGRLLRGDLQLAYLGALPLPLVTTALWVAAVAALYAVVLGSCSRVM